MTTNTATEKTAFTVVKVSGWAPAADSTQLCAYLRRLLDRQLPEAGIVVRPTSSEYYVDVLLSGVGDRYTSQIHMIGEACSAFLAGLAEGRQEVRREHLRKEIENFDQKLAEAKQNFFPA